MQIRSFLRFTCRILLLLISCSFSTVTGCVKESGPTAQPVSEVSNAIPPALPTDTKPEIYDPNASLIDVTQTAGLHYKWAVARHPTDILDGVGVGCGFLDYNNDGNLDILLVGADKLALYKGDGHGHFTDVTQQMGLDKLKGHFHGCAVGDYDNDGYDDVYISGYYTGVLLHNEQGKGFKDVTKQMGISPQRWGTSAAFADVDGDGYLDLFVANYVDYTSKSKVYCPQKGIVETCGPLDYPALSGTMYHSLKGRKFEDVTARWGMNTQSGAGLGVAFADYDESGHESLAIANDLHPGDLFRNVGDNRLFNVAVASGASLAPDGHAHAGMGIDWGDYDNDGRLDLLVTTFQHEQRSLYHNNGYGLFSDAASLTGIMQASMEHLAFGCKFIDIDNDGWLDIIIANGHVQDNIAKIEPKTSYRQTPQLFRNRAKDMLRYEDVSRKFGLEQIKPMVGRGLAIGDFDNDGRMDILIADSDGPPVLLHNQLKPTGHWLLCKLIGTKSNRDAIGALVTAEAGDLKLLRRCGSDGSYLSASDLRVHIGLGEVKSANLTVQWPSGAVSHYPNVPADRIVTLKEGDPTVR